MLLTILAGCMQKFFNQLLIIIFKREKNEKVDF
jgi:hypothetical protein